MGQKRSTHRSRPRDEDSAAQSVDNLVGRLSLQPAESFGELSETQNILLLTPYLHHPPPHEQVPAATDPFEGFGRTMSEYHSQIRHCPYVAKEGMTDVHQRLLREAGALVVVICAAPLDPAEGEKLDSERDQARAAREARRVASRLGIPNALMMVGFKSKDLGFDLALHCEQWSQLEHCAGVLFSN